MSVGPGGAARRCERCGRPLAPSAAFCRSCGGRPEPAAPRRGRGGAMVLAAVAAGLLLGGGFAAAVLLGGEDAEPPTGPAPGSAATVPIETAEPTRESGEADSPAKAPDRRLPPPAGSAVAGQYVQAGSFRTVAGAGEEQLRLASHGIEVEVVASDRMQQLYPGFQVLLAGPFAAPGPIRSVLKRLHDNGVPSAFARRLDPAAAIVGGEAIGGRWSGALERSGSEQEWLNGSLRVTVTGSADGRTAQLDFSKPDCETSLSLAAASAVALTYDQRRECVGDGQWHLRPRGSSLSLTLLPPDSDVIVVGELSAE